MRSPDVQKGSFQEHHGDGTEICFVFLDGIGQLHQLGPFTSKYTSLGKDSRTSELVLVLPLEIIHSNAYE